MKRVKESSLRNSIRLKEKLLILLLSGSLLMLSGCLGKYQVSVQDSDHSPLVCFSLKKDTISPTIAFRKSCLSSTSNPRTFSMKEVSGLFSRTVNYLREFIVSKILKF